MALHITRKFGTVEIVYDGEEDVSFVVEMPSGKTSIFLPYDPECEETGVYGVYGAYNAYQSGYSFISESMIKRKKNKQFANFKPTEKGEHKVKVIGKKEEKTIVL